jgi:hypothetical protein
MLVRRSTRHIRGLYILYDIGMEWRSGSVSHFKFSSNEALGFSHDVSPKGVSIVLLVATPQFFPNGIQLNEMICPRGLWLAKSFRRQN